MAKQDVTTKLAATEANLKRWQTRLKRAHTKVFELDRARRRYQLMLLHPDKPEIATSFRVKGQVVVPKEADTGRFAPMETPKAEVIAAVAKAKDDSDFPAFLNRADPHVAAKLTAARKKAEAEERKKMPLTGRDALKKIREKK